MLTQTRQSSHEENMLIYISENVYGGANKLLRKLKNEWSFTILDDIGDGLGDVDAIIAHATENFTKNLAMRGSCTLEELNKLEKRPFFLHITIDASLRARYANFCEEIANKSLEDFLDFAELQLQQSPQLPQVRDRANIKLYITKYEHYQSEISQVLAKQLREVNQGKDIRVPFQNTTPLRPDWDSYFMKLATLAASRSNCMKRRVGCVIVRDRRVIATGYNGTPRHLVNCHSGGCPRCNNGGAELNTCLCLHAEENALLEAGRDRVGSNAILYCDTCPCLTCSVKIVQTGVREVVYSQSYRMDEASFKVLQEGGVLVRQFSVLEEPRFVVV